MLRPLNICLTLGGKASELKGLVFYWALKLLSPAAPKPLSPALPLLLLSLAIARSIALLIG